MSKFCGACGAAVPEGAGFCGACGANTQQAAVAAPQSGFHPISQPQAPAAAPVAEFQPVAQTAPTPSAVPPAQAPTSVKSSSPWIKVAIVAIVIIFVGGAIAVAGVIYVAHRVSQKAQEYKREILERRLLPVRLRVLTVRRVEAQRHLNPSPPSWGFHQVFQATLAAC